MRATVAGFLTAAAAASALAAGVAAQDKAADVMAQMRTAMGGEKKLAAVQALSLRGTYQREMPMPGMGPGRTTMELRGGPPPGGPGGPGGSITGEIELDVALPDKFIRVDTSTGFMGMTRTEGFEGERPFASVVPANPGMRIRIDSPASDPARAGQALARGRAELARLLLGVLGTTPASFPVTYSYGGVAESPDGKADIVDVQGPDGFAARLFVDAKSHLPLMLTYMAPEPRIVVATTDRGEHESPEEERARLEKEAAANPPKLVEFRLYFAGYQETGGLTLPHRISRGSAGKTTEEWEIKSYRINPSFKADRFKVS